MAAGFKPGDKAYIVENNRVVRECTIARASGNLFVIRFVDGGGIQLPAHRLFATKEAAEESIPKVAAAKPQRGYRSPYDYWH
ncbi:MULTISPECIES: hypothetical protein [unclassified Blautia]|uniref:hypothetical protein n=1 Tax=unclassified Blautia TaxID=2648079 RepID=UPI003F8B9FA2